MKIGDPENPKDFWGGGKAAETLGETIVLLRRSEV
jgi:hypothetical protein